MLSLSANTGWSMTPQPHSESLLCQRYILSVHQEGIYIYVYSTFCSVLYQDHWVSQNNCSSAITFLPLTSKWSLGLRGQSLHSHQEQQSVALLCNHCGWGHRFFLKLRSHRMVSTRLCRPWNTERAVWRCSCITSCFQHQLYVLRAFNALKTQAGVTLDAPGKQRVTFLFEMSPCVLCV